MIFCIVFELVGHICTKVCVWRFKWASGIYAQFSNCKFSASSLSDNKYIVQRLLFVINCIFGVSQTREHDYELSKAFSIQQMYIYWWNWNCQY